MKLKCTAPDEIEDADLLAYIAGQAEPTIVAHIEGCLFCQQEVEAFVATDLLLHDAAYRQDCPDSDLLWQYASQLLTGAALKETEAHVATCTTCQAEVAQLQTAVYQEPVRLSHAEKPTLVEQLTSAGKRFIEAVLQPPPQPVLAVRGSAQASLTFLAESYQITLKKVPPLAGRDVWEIEGQLIHLADPLREYVGEVHLRRHEETIATTTLNELGYFVLTAVTQDIYTIHIELDVEHINIPEVTIP